MHQGNNCFWGMHDNHWGAPGIWVFWTAIIIIVAVGLYFLMRSTQGNNYSQRKVTPLDILKRRYAMGDITSEEFEEKKKVISTH